MWGLYITTVHVDAVSPILGGITGRAYDIIHNKEGKAFHGEYFMYIFEELQNQDIYVSSFQVIQMDCEAYHQTGDGSAIKKKSWKIMFCCLECMTHTVPTQRFNLNTSQRSNERNLGK